MGTTAAELMAQLAERYRSDPEYRARVDADRRRREAAAAERTRQHAPFGDDLAREGVTETYDLTTGKLHADRRIVEVALAHLDRDGYSDDVRSWIASHLATRASEPYWDRLMKLLRAAPASSREKFQLAHALGVCARAKDVDLLMELVKDSSIDVGRVALLRPINRLGRARGKEFVSTLVDDPDLGWEARRIMRGVGPSAP